MDPVTTKVVPDSPVISKKKQSATPTKTAGDIKPGSDKFTTAAASQTNSAKHMLTNRSWLHVFAKNSIDYEAGGSGVKLSGLLKSLFGEGLEDTFGFQLLTGLWSNNAKNSNFPLTEEAIGNNISKGDFSQKEVGQIKAFDKDTQLTTRMGRIYTVEPKKLNELFSKETFLKKLKANGINDDEIKLLKKLLTGDAESQVNDMKNVLVSSNEKKTLTTLLNKKYPALLALLREHLPKESLNLTTLSQSDRDQVLAIEATKKKNPATTIQAKVRGNQARKKLEAKKDAAIKIQTAARGSIEKNKFTAKKDAATTIQAKVRGNQARKKAADAAADAAIAADVAAEAAENANNWVTSYEKKSEFFGVTEIPTKFEKGAKMALGDGYLRTALYQATTGNSPENAKDFYFPATNKLAGYSPEGENFSRNNIYRIRELPPNILRNMTDLYNNTTLGKRKKLFANEGYREELKKNGIDDNEIELLKKLLTTDAESQVKHMREILDSEADSKRLQELLGNKYETILESLVIDPDLMELNKIANRFADEEVNPQSAGKKKARDQVDALHAVGLARKIINEQKTSSGFIKEQIGRNLGKILNAFKVYQDNGVKLPQDLEKLIQNGKGKPYRDISILIDDFDRVFNADEIDGAMQLAVGTRIDEVLDAKNPAETPDRTAEIAAEIAADRVQYKTTTEQYERYERAVEKAKNAQILAKITAERAAETAAETAQYKTTTEEYEKAVVEAEKAQRSAERYKKLADRTAAEAAAQTAEQAIIVGIRKKTSPVIKRAAERAAERTNATKEVQMMLNEDKKLN